MLHYYQNCLKQLIQMYTKVYYQLFNFYLLTFRETQSCYVHSPEWPQIPNPPVSAWHYSIRYSTTIPRSVANLHPTEVLGNQTQGPVQRCKLSTSKVTFQPITNILFCLRTAQLDVVAHGFNSMTWKAAVGGSSMFEASLVYIANSRPGRTKQRNTVSKQNKRTTKNRESL